MPVLVAHGAAATMALMEQWGEQAAATAAAQVPFLALLQGAMAEEQDDDKRQYAAFACPRTEDAGLLESCVTHATAPAANGGVPGQQRRRKRPRARPRAAPAPEAKRKKPAEEAECQRMTHIAVERNRRRLMNDHLASLRSLIPSDYIPRVSHPCLTQEFINLTSQCRKKSRIITRNLY